MDNIKRIREQLRDVGVGRFNRAHKQLMDLIQEFDGIVSQLFKKRPNEQQWREIDDIMSRLHKYARDHFKDEENLMRQHAYPLTKEHAEQHRDLLKRLEKFTKHLKEKDARFSVDMQFFLLDWLFTHINRYDMKYKAFFEEKNVR